MAQCEYPQKGLKSMSSKFEIPLQNKLSIPYIYFNNMSVLTNFEMVVLI